MKRILINPPINQLGEYVIDQDYIDSLDIGIHKNLSWNMFKNSNYGFHIHNVVESMLDNMNGSFLICVKVTVNQTGRPVCIPGFHSDLVRDLQDPRSIENHCLWVSHTGTEFLLDRGPVPITDPSGACDFTEALNHIDTTKIFKIKPYSIVGYNRLNLHRGCESESNAKRLLIRVTSINDNKGK